MTRIIRTLAQVLGDSCEEETYNYQLKTKNYTNYRPFFKEDSRIMSCVFKTFVSGVGS